jgi:hypothetical protein
MATFEDATKLGLAVQAFLARPPLDPLLDAHTPTDLLRYKITAQLWFLETRSVLTAAEGITLRDYVQNGTLPEPPSGPALLTPGVLLTSVVLFLRATGPGGLFGDMPLALSHVVDATVDGALHAGQDGALTCAALATTQVLQGLESVEAKVSDVAVQELREALYTAHGMKPLSNGVKPHGVKPHGVKPHGVKP